MNGTIGRWQTNGSHGTIHAEDGRHLPFSTDAVWPYDLTRIGVGQVVSFELSRSDGSVMNVRREPEPLVSALKTSPTTGHLEYQGFEHVANTRAYQFQRRVTAHPTEHFVVRVELSLLAKHRIGLQEGPAICGRMLTEELKALGGLPAPEQTRVLTEQDLLIYFVPRAVIPPRSRRTGFPHLRAAERAHSAV
jgi:hypothetical protein